MAEAFLSKEEIYTLTGRKIPSKQIEQLKAQRLPFFVNALGRPVVARSVIEGTKSTAQQQKQAWAPGL